jgi:hypothetical protein
MGRKQPTKKAGNPSRNCRRKVEVWVGFNRRSQNRSAELWLLDSPRRRPPPLLPRQRAPIEPAPPAIEPPAIARRCLAINAVPIATGGHHHVSATRECRKRAGQRTAEIPRARAAAPIRRQRRDDGLAERETIRLIPLPAPIRLPSPRRRACGSLGHAVRRLSLRALPINYASTRLRCPI